MYRSLSSEGNFTDEQADTLTKHLRDVATLNIEHLATKKDLGHLEERMNHRFLELEQRLTIKLGGMMVLGLGVIVALQQIMGG
ncbi:MAG: hypothetical protein AAFV88_22810 [Planctomycetota bacterium]